MADDVVDGVVALEVGRDPDLVHLAALREQQLADGLTTLDLFAAEALVGTCGPSVSLGRRGSCPVRPAPRLRGRPRPTAGGGAPAAALTGGRGR